MSSSFAPEATGLHIVQVSWDAGLLTCAESDERVQRQLRYAAMLAQRWPGAWLSLVVMTAKTETVSRDIGNLRIRASVGSSLGRRLGIYSKLRALHRLRPIDLVVVQQIFDEAWIVLVFARLNGARVLAQDHWDITLPAADAVLFGSGLFGRLRRALGWRALRYFVGLRVVGTGALKRLKESRSHWRIACIPVPVTAPPLAAPRVPAGSRAPLVLFAGRLAPQKNLPFWISVAARVHREFPAARFRIVGAGPERANLVAQAAKTGLDGALEFVEAVPHAELGDAYASARVFLLTSHFEGLGRVLVEAGMLGCPAVASDAGGMTDAVVDGVTGYLFNPGDLETAANRVLALLRDDALASRMGAAAAEHMARTFDRDRLSAEWVDFMVGSVARPMRQLLAPRPRTVARYRGIAASPYSTLRALEYECIREIHLAGRTLDVGGGQLNSYWKLLRIDGPMESVNISPDMQPTYVADLSAGIPVGDAQYDNVISLNTFEHVFDDITAIKEALRVLKPGGVFHIVIPFMYRVHASPSDFHRRTAMWWGQTLERNGISADAYVIEPLTWDRLATAYSFFGQGTLGRFVRRLVLLPAVLRDLGSTRSRRLHFSSEVARDIEVALGYYITGRK